MGYIDAHTHIWFKEVLPKSTNIPSVNEIVEEMDKINMDYAVIIAYPSREVWGTKEDFAIAMINFLKNYSSRFSIIGGVEVNKLSYSEVKYWIERQYEAGVSGFKVHPVHQWIKPNDYREEEKGNKGLEYLYEFAQDHDLPVIIHTGTSMFEKARNKYGDPIYVDDVAVDFPKLKIVLAHMGRPNWVQTAFQLVRIRPNIIAEISSIPPKKLLDYIPRLEEISDKTIYGSDYGGPGVKSLSDNLLQFLSLNISDNAKNKIASKNPHLVYKPLSR